MKDRTTEEIAHIFPKTKFMDEFSSRKDFSLLLVDIIKAVIKNCNRKLKNKAFERSELRMKEYKNTNGTVSK